MDSNGTPHRDTPHRDCVQLSELNFENRIGLGSRGQIFKASDGAGTIVAVKVMNRNDEETGTEITALTRVQGHVNIIAMRGAVEVRC
jgi:hypothetical protein